MTDKPTDSTEAQNENPTFGASVPEPQPDEAGATGGSSRPLVFISHRHHDAEIAKAIADWIMASSLNKIDVFLSSDGLRGTEVARSITEQIRRKVADAAVLIAVYTDQEADWAWVMFEIGIGMDPTTPQTNVVVIQCGDDFPTVLSEFKRIRVSEESDRISLARDFLTTDFFPTHPGWRLATTSSEDFVREQAANLWSKLDKFIPPPPLGRDWSLHPKIRVEIPLSEVGALHPIDAARLDGLRLLVRERAKVVWEDDTRTVFTLMTLVGSTLAQLEAALSIQNQDGWIESCVDHLTRCLVGHRPTEPMKQVFTTSGEGYQPLVISTQHKRFDRVGRFEILFVPSTLVTPNNSVSTTESPDGTDQIALAPTRESSRAPNPTDRAG